MEELVGLGRHGNFLGRGASGGGSGSGSGGVARGGVLRGLGGVKHIGEQTLIDVDPVDGIVSIVGLEGVLGDTVQEGNELGELIDVAYVSDLQGPVAGGAQRCGWSRACGRGSKGGSQSIEQCLRLIVVRRIHGVDGISDKEPLVDLEFLGLHQHQ